MRTKNTEDRCRFALLVGQTTGVETKTPAGTTRARVGYRHDGAGRRPFASRQ